MDSLTHIVLGACIGEVVAGKQLGKKAWLVGAVLQTIPDLDFIAGLWLSPAEDLLAHRGFTHSFLFVILISLFLASLLSRMKWGHRLSTSSWLFFCLTGTLVHLLLDAMNVYGTAWFEPFSHIRIAFNVLFVADPFFTMPLLVACLLLLSFKKTTINKRMIAQAALTLSFLYIVFASITKWQVNQVVKENLNKSTKEAVNYFSTPAPFNPWLWYVVEKVDTTFRMGYYSVFDSSNQIRFSSIQQHKSLLPLAADQESLVHLIRFSQGYYALKKENGSIVLNDLRFGKIMGWSQPNSPFVFYFYLHKSADNQVVIQRGRMKGWSISASKEFIRRIFSIHAK